MTSPSPIWSRSYWTGPVSKFAKFYDALLAAQYALEFQPHTIITDYSMPHMNGLELATWLHKHCPDCKTVIITGEAAVVAEKAHNGLKFALLQKPVSSCVLIAESRELQEPDDRNDHCSSQVPSYAG